MNIKQYLTLDQYDKETANWVDRIVNEYDLKGLPFVELHGRSVCSQYHGPLSGKLDENIVSDDMIFEIIVDDKLFAFKYQRRNSFNGTENTEVVIGNKKLIKQLKKRFTKM